MSIQDMEDLKQQYLDEMKSLINSEYRNEIKINELKENFNGMSIEINKKKKLQKLEQVANLMREYYKNSHVEITPDFPNGLSHNDLLPPGINEADFDPKEEIRLVERLLYDSPSPRPLKDFNTENSDVIIESFSPSPIPSFHFDIPSSPRPPSKPPDDDEIKPDTGVLTTKVVGDISEHYVLMPRLLPTEPTLASNEDKSPHLLSHRGFKAFQLSFESPMMIYGGNIPILDVPLLPTEPTLASNEDKSPHLLSHRGFKAFQLSFKSPMMIYGGNIPILDVPFLHFYPP
nr:hypothetical protein [Tanacetum cinerariifolium]